MKKIIAFALLAAMLLGLCACGGGNANEQQAEPAPSFSVGYARVNITPKNSTNLPMEGYKDQVSQGYLMPMMGTCIAITDTAGTTMLLYTVDRCESELKSIEPLRAKLTSELGIPGEYVSVNSTHTHSSPKIDYMPDYIDNLVQAAKEAMADRAPATIATGSYDVPNMNFTRHYHMKDGTIAGDNYGSTSVGYQDYTSEADHTMRLIRFERADKKDIVMVNWQVHPKLTSTADTTEGMMTRNLLSPDFIGYTRDHVEATDSDVLFAYFTGAAANVNPFSKLPDQRNVVSKDAKVYGKQFGDHVIAALKDLKPAESGNIATKSAPLGTRGFTLHAYSIGSGIGFATVPAEIFHETGTQIREGSPFETTFVLSCTNGRDTYIPIDEVWDYKTNDTSVPYEVSICRYPRGTAESLAQDLATMLTELKGN